MNLFFYGTMSCQQCKSFEIGVSNLVVRGSMFATISLTRRVITGKKDTMASQSGKKLATSNAQTLQELHVISLVINLVVFASITLFGRPARKWPYFVFSIPAFGSQIILEKSGRPKYSMDSISGQVRLLRSGDDIKGPGLFEYMFDCIYVTWVCDLLMVLLGSNKVWFMTLIIPAFLAFKILSFTKSFKGTGASLAMVDSEGRSAERKEKSKRQAKLEQRSQKGKRVSLR